jgi:hypothetical protein
MERLEPRRADERTLASRAASSAEASGLLASMEPLRAQERDGVSRPPKPDPATFGEVDLDEVARWRVWLGAFIVFLYVLALVATVLFAPR